MANLQASDCPHQSQVNNEVLNPASTVCAECGLSAPTRVCMTCGHIGCCESTNGHGRAHALENQHPLIRELPNTERSFTWCYDCNAYIK